MLDLRLACAGGCDDNRSNKSPRRKPMQIECAGNIAQNARAIIYCC